MARSFIGIALAPLAIVSAPCLVSAEGFMFEKIIVQGEAAPGTEAGTVFAFPNSYIPVVPHIDNLGTIAFAGQLTGPYVNSTNATGLWRGTPGSLELVARAGSPAPGTPAGVVFRGFPESFELISPETGASRLVFSGALTGPGVDLTNDAGVWAGPLGSLDLIARTGSPAPGGTGLVFTQAFHVGGSFGGDALIVGRVHGAGVTSDTDEAFWTDRDGALQMILREGDAAPGLPGLVFGGAGDYIGTGYSFESVIFSHASQMAAQANLTGAGVDAFSNEALWREQNGQLSLLAREGDDAPGVPGSVTFGGNGVTSGFGFPALNALGQSAFTTYLGGSVPTSYAMFSDHLGSLGPVVLPGDPAPGTDEQFGVFGDPILSDAGFIAFRSSLSSGGSYPPFGIFWDVPGHALAPLLLPDDPLPGAPETTILGANYLWAFNAANQLAFGASLDDPVNGWRPAILLAQPDGSIEVVVQWGDPFDVFGDGSEYREVSGFQFGGMNDAGTMAIRLEFTDGTFGFYTASRNGPTSVTADAARVEGFRLEPCAPNPFRGSTTVRFALPAAAAVKVDVVDVAGRLVARLLEGRREAGAHAIVWDGRVATGGVAPSGVYFLRASAGATTKAAKIVKID
jgi:hypothetical protein